jgi:hypothetical protein
MWRRLMAHVPVEDVRIAPEWRHRLMRLRDFGPNNFEDFRWIRCMDDPTCVGMADALEMAHLDLETVPRLQFTSRHSVVESGLSPRSEAESLRWKLEEDDLYTILAGTDNDSTSSFAAVVRSICETYNGFLAKTVSRWWDPMLLIADPDAITIWTVQMLHWHASRNLPSRVELLTRMGGPLGPCDWVDVQFATDTDPSQDYTVDSISVHRSFVLTKNSDIL